MSILEQLKAEMRQLPKLLQDESIWKDLLVTYEPPMVERLFTQRGENRLFLHRIHPCGDRTPLLHPHPWASAVAIVSGTYKMEVSYCYEINDVGQPTQYANDGVITTYLSAGSFYEMSMQEAWHNVNPIGGPSLSIMLIAPKWENSHYDRMVKNGMLIAPFHKQPNLLPDMRAKLFEDFRKYFR